MSQTKPLGRPGIDRQRYINQIEQWLGEGKRLDEITATALQKVVGGQYRKAAEILAEFAEGYEARELADLPPPPERLVNLLNSAALDIWRLLCEESRQEVEQAQAEFDRDREALQQLATERLDRIDALEDQAADQARQLQEGVEALAEQRGELARLREQLAEQAERNSQLTQRLSDRDRELAASSQELRDTRAQLKEFGQDLEQERKKSGELAGRLRDTKGELVQAITEGKRLKVENAQQAEALAADREQLQHLQQTVADRDQALAVVSAKLEAAADAGKQARKDLHDCQADNKRAAEAAKAEQAVLSELLSNAGASLSAKTAEADQLAKACSAAEARAERLEAQLLGLAKGQRKK